MSEVVRKHSPSNYALEVYGNKSVEDLDTWFQVKDGFVSPEKALEYAAKERIEGQVRVVRIASPLYGGKIVTPEPVYSLKKVVTEEKKIRKPRLSKASETPGLVGQSQHISREQAIEAFDAKNLPDSTVEIVLDGVGERQGPGEDGEALPPDEGLNPDPDETV